MSAVLAAMSIGAPVAATSEDSSAATLALEEPDQLDLKSSQLTAVEPGLPDPPPLKSKAYALLDMQDGAILAEQAITQRRAIASLTKIMTALIIVERTKPDDQVEISEAAAKDNEGSSVGLRAGETYSVQQLLDAVLIYSANDAAKALAEHVAGSQSEFIAMMNERARRLSLDDTKYASVSGLDSTPLTLSTAADQLVLANVALRDPQIAKAVATKSLKFTSADGTATTYANRNPLLRTYDGVNGMKTGHTDEAGYCLLASYDKDGIRFLTIVLGAASEAQRARETRSLLDFGQALSPELTLVTGDEPVGTIPVEWSGREVEIFPSNDVTARVRVGSRITERYEMPRVLEGPLSAGDEVGNLSIYADNRLVGQTKLFIAKGAPKVTNSMKAELIASRWKRALELGTTELRRAGQGVQDV